VIAPGAGEGKAEALADELREGLAGVAEAIVTLAVWRAGDEPEDVVARARAGGDGNIPIAPAPSPVARDV